MLEELLSEVDSHIRAQHQLQNKSRVAFLRRYSAITARRRKRRADIIERSARELGLDLVELREEHRKGRELRTRLLERQRKEADGEIRERRDRLRVLRAHVARNSGLLNREKGNPEGWVCLGLAAGSSSDEVSIAGEVAANVTHQFTPQMWDNKLDLKVSLKGMAGLSGYYYKHWIHLVWEQGPANPSIADVSVWLDLGGVIESECADDCDPILARAHVTTLDALLYVSQPGNQGLVVFPEKTERLVTIDLDEGQSDTATVNRNWGLAFPGPIPLEAGAPVVITAGIQFGGVLSEDDTATLDLSSDWKDLRLDMAVIHHRS